MDNQLPAGWRRTTLGSIAEWGSGGTPSRRNSEFFRGNIPWVKTGELTGKYVRDSEEKISVEGLQKSSAKLFPAGSVGIAMYGATIGKLSIFAIDATTNQACAVAIPNKDMLHNEFLYYFLLSEKQKLIDSGKGGAQPNISQGLLKSWPIALPDVPEQKCIVAKIEELFSELDNGIKSLKTAREQLKIYRQSLLKHAFEGKLTEQWRKENTDKLETPEQLLARIQQEREAHYQQQLDEWKLTVKEWEESKRDGIKPKNPVKPDALSVSNIRPQILLPENWCWMKFGDVVTIASNLVPPLDYKNLPHIAPDNIERDTGKLLSYKTVEEDGVTSPKHYFYSGQIIYSKIRPNLSKLVYVDFDGLCSADMYPLQSDCYRHIFLKYLMLTKDFVTQASTAGSRSVLPKINQTELSKLLVPLCGLKEQQEIVSQLEEKLSIIEQNEKEIEAALAKADLLRQSILKKAFSGQLVPQDLNSEPASELLARVQTESEIIKTQNSKKARGAK